MQRNAEETWFPKLPMGSTKIVLRNLGINLAVIRESNTKEMTFSPCLYMQKHDGSRNSDYTIKEPLALKYLDVTNIFVCVDDYCYSFLG